MRIRIRVPVLTALLLSFLLLLSFAPRLLGPAQAAGSQMPDEALTLMPADALAILVYSSLDDIEQHLVVPLREAADEDEVDDLDAMELLPDDIHGLTDVIDRTRPIALVISLGMQYGPPEPIQTLLIPVMEGADPEAMAMVSGLASAEVHGGYVALSADPNYQAAGAVPALAENLPSGQLAGRIDLETAFLMMGPMVEMMLSAMEEQARQDPDAETLPEPMMQGIRGLIASARIGEFSVDEQDGELEFRLALDVFAGSVLDVGPQPPLEDALKLAGHLPDWGELMMVYAMDLELLYQNLPFLREPSMMQLSKAMAEPQSEAASAWLMVADELTRPLERASSATARVQETGIEYVQVAALDGAQDQLEKIAAHLASLPEAQLGFVLHEEASETRDDLRYRRYRWDFDPDQLMQMMGEDSEDELPDAEEMDEFTEFMRTMAPPLHLAALPDRMLMALMPEGPELDAVLDRFVASPQMPPMALEGLSNWAGDDIQMLAQVELRSLLREVAEAVAKLDPDEGFEIADGEPVRLRYAVEAGEVRHSARLQTRTGALIRFIKELDEMEDDEDATSRSHETEEE